MSVAIDAIDAEIEAAAQTRVHGSNIEARTAADAGLGIYLHGLLIAKQVAIRAESRKLESEHANRH